MGVTMIGNDEITLPARLGPLFRPLKQNGKRQDERRHMDPDAIDRVVRKCAGELGLTAVTRRTRCERHSSLIQHANPSTRSRAFSQ